MSKLSELKNKDTDREKINMWLDFIGEFDEDCRADVLQHCKESTEARAYYVGRWEKRSELDKFRTVPDRKSIAAGETE